MKPERTSSDYRTLRLVGQLPDQVSIGRPGGNGVGQLHAGGRSECLSGVRRRLVDLLAEASMEVADEVRV